MSYYSIYGLGQVGCDFSKSSQCDSSTGICYDSMGCPMTTNAMTGKSTEDESSFWGDFASGLKDVVEIATPVATTALTIQAQREAAKRAAAAAAQGQTIPNYQNPVVIQRPVAAQSGTPSWVLPVSIVGGIGVVGLIAVLALK